MRIFHVPACGASVVCSPVAAKRVGIVQSAHACIFACVCPEPSEDISVKMGLHISAKKNRKGGMGCVFFFAVDI